jgi:hypothetical protein
MIEAESIAKSDLHIEMVKYMHVQFSGTRAQLIEEGLIPEGLEWSNKQHCRAQWSVGSYDYTLMRCRPPGMKGKQSVLANIDYWKLSFRPEDALSKLSNRRFELTLLEARQFMERDTPEWRRRAKALTKALGRARQDDKFMTFFDRLQGR